MINIFLRDGRICVRQDSAAFDPGNSGPYSFKNNLLQAYHWKRPESVVVDFTEVRDGDGQMMRGLFDLWREVNSRSGTLTVVNFPAKDIPALISTGLAALEGLKFEETRTKSDHTLIATLNQLSNGVWQPTAITVLMFGAITHSTLSPSHMIFPVLFAAINAALIVHGTMLRLRKPD